MRRRHLLVVPATGLLLAGLAAPLAVAQSDDAVLVHRESILAEVDATGTVGTSRVFTQLTVPAGSGEVVLPGQSTSGLRGLSGAGPSVDGDTLRFDGNGTIRTVANSTADLPVSIEIRYAIDGEQVEPADVLGHDGEVAVTYVVRNLTAEPTELTVVDGDGETTTETVDVAVPMVGSLSMTLPGAYRDIVAPGAVVVGDGRGGTVVNWSLLLFSPLGSETQEVTWTARVTDAVVPPASLQVLPVTPDSFGSLASTEAAYAGAVDSTTELTDGAREIDANLRRLAEGAGTLLAGLTQLRDGADELATGLVGAADGAGDLSDGLGQARTGADELSTGLGDLATGATALADGLGTAQAGGNQLTSGLGQLAAGADELAAGSRDVAAGATTLDARAGELASGAGEVAAGAELVRQGLVLLSTELQGSEGFPAILAGLDAMTTSLTTQLVPLADALVAGLAGSPLLPTAQMLRGGLSNPTALATNPTCDRTVAPTNPCGMAEGLAVLRGGLDLKATELAGRLGSVDQPGQTLLYGAQSLADGAARLAAGARQLREEGTAPLAAGAGQVSAGAAQVAGGAASALAGGGDLTDGLGRLAGGGLELADGAARAAAGGVELGNGLVQLDEGGAQLADGLGAAIDGSRQIADGLDAAAGGGQEVADGAEQLGDEGTAVLADSVSEATTSSSLQLEQVRAVAARGVAGDGLPYPTAEGATATAVYQFDLAGVGSTDGPGAVGRFGIGAVALALAIGVLLGRRRRVTVLPEAEVSVPDRVTA